MNTPFALPASLTLAESIAEAKSPEGVAHLLEMFERGEIRLEGLLLALAALRNGLH